MMRHLAFFASTLYMSAQAVNLTENSSLIAETFDSDFQEDHFKSLAQVSIMKSYSTVTKREIHSLYRPMPVSSEEWEPLPMLP